MTNAHPGTDEVFVIKTASCLASAPSQQQVSAVLENAYCYAAIPLQKSFSTKTIDSFGGTLTALDLFYFGDDPALPTLNVNRSDGTGLAGVGISISGYFMKRLP
jgi:hypothetical protein